MGSNHTCPSNYLTFLAVCTHPASHGYLIDTLQHAVHNMIMEVSKPIETPPPKVSSKLSAAKAVSWRVIGTFDTLVLSWLVITFVGPLFGHEGN